MRSLYFFWYHLNWLEFVTYVVIPTAIVLVILVYIYFNLSLFRKLLHISFLDENKILSDLYLDDLKFVSYNKNNNNNQSNNSVTNEKVT